MRVVVDTNVLVSSLFSSEGNEAQIIHLIGLGSLTLLVSDSIYAEYETVLKRKKFQFAGVRVEALLATLRRLAVWISIPSELVLTISPDESDNRFLECAQVAMAAFLITGNQRHFPLRHGVTKVVKAGEFLRLFGDPI